MAKILVTIPDEFLSKVDGLATTEKISRSELIRDALRNYIRKTTTSNSKNAAKNAKTLENLIG